MIGASPDTSSGAPPGASSGYRVRAARILIPVAGALSGLLLSALLLVVLGKSLPDAYGALWDGSVGSAFAWGNTLNKGAALAFCALGFVICFRARLVSVGQEGQLYIGAMASTAAVLALDGVAPAIVGVPAAVAAGAAGGALWGALAGVLKARFAVNETISTLLLNFVAVYLVGYSVQVEALLRQEITNIATEPQSRAVPESLRLPQLDPDGASQAHSGMLIALVMVAVVAFILNHTVFGFRVRQLGGNPTMVARTGAKPDWLTVKILALSGAVAGLAGPSLVLGEQFRLRADISDGIGFNGIAAALMGSGTPVGAAVSSLFLGGLKAGGNLMEIRADVNAFIVLVIQGIVIVLVAAGAISMRGESRALFRQAAAALRLKRRPAAEPVKPVEPNASVEPGESVDAATVDAVAPGKSQQGDTTSKAPS